MWNLIVKDLYLQRLKLTLAALIGAAVGGMFFNTDLGSGGLHPAVLVFILIITYSFTAYSCYHEDKNKSISFLRSLPVPARVVVNSKFAAVIVLEAIMLTTLFIILYLGKITGISAISAFFANFSIVILMGLVALLYNSIVLFIFFRWGYNEMQWAFVFVVFFGGMLLGRIVPKVPVVFPGISPGQGAVLGTLLVLLLVFLCWKGSVWALNKKDVI